MPKMNVIGTLRAFFTQPELKMDELKAFSSSPDLMAARTQLGRQARDEMIRQGTHKAEDFEQF